MMYPLADKLTYQEARRLAIQYGCDIATARKYARCYSHGERRQPTAGEWVILNGYPRAYRMEYTPKIAFLLAYLMLVDDTGNERTKLYKLTSNLGVKHATDTERTNH